MRKRLLLSPFVLAVTALAPAASAAPTSPASPSTSHVEKPKFDELPVGLVTAPPNVRRPAAIGAREKVPGFFVVNPTFPAGTPIGNRHVAVTDNAALAESIRTSKFEGEAQGCLAEWNGEFDPNRARNEAENDDPHAFEWDTSVMSQLTLWYPSKDNPRAGVAAVHSEHFRDGASPSLESVDAWIDPTTHGQRLIGKASLPLKLVGTAIGGVRVFAARDERPDGRKFVEYVVVLPDDKAVNNIGSMMVNSANGGMSHANGCNHLRVQLALGSSGGENAVYLVPTLLPSLEALHEADALHDAEAPKKDEKIEVDVTRRFLKRIKRRAAAMGPGEEPVELRLRQMNVEVGLSRASKDPEPLLSVAFGWNAREQVVRVSAAQLGPRERDAD